MHFGVSVIEFAGCQRVVLDAPLSRGQSRALTCAAGCQRVILDAPLSPVQSRPISRGRHVSLPSRYNNIRCESDIERWPIARALFSKADVPFSSYQRELYTSRATICKFQI